MSEYDEDQELIENLRQRLERLKAENDRLRKYRDVMETAHGKRLYEAEMLREHFDDSGELLGDGKWRLRQIAEAVMVSDMASTCKGYIVLVCINHEWDVVSYGTGKEPYRDQLLRRGRAAVFATKSKAADAIKKQVEIAKAEKCDWIKKAAFQIVELTGDNAE